MIQTAPAGWTPDKLAAFNDLSAAVQAYYVYSSALALLGVTDPAARQIATDLAGLIRGTLLPRLLAT